MAGTASADTVFSEGHTPTFDERQRAREADARRRIAFVLVGAYVVLLALYVLAPILAVKLVGAGDEQVTALKSASESVGAVVTGVAGLLGFVLGYYFRSEEQKQES